METNPSPVRTSAFTAWSIETLRYSKLKADLFIDSVADLQLLGFPRDQTKVIEDVALKTSFSE